MGLKEFKNILLDKLKDTLKQRHFRKTGNTFSFSNGELSYFIGLQSSRDSTSDILKVTVNTEIRSELISKLETTSLPIEHQRHYTRRIGSYFDDEQDKWWTINNSDSAEIVANEISNIIVDKVIPNFDTLKTTNDLAALWRTNGYLGITQGQRENYLALIDKATK